MAQQPQKPKKTITVEHGEPKLKGDGFFQINLIANVRVGDKIPTQEENVQFCVDGVPNGNPVSTNQGRAILSLELPKGSYAIDAYLESGAKTTMLQIRLEEKRTEKSSPKARMTYTTIKNQQGHYLLNLHFDLDGKSLSQNNVLISNADMLGGPIEETTDADGNLTNILILGTPGIKKIVTVTMHNPSCTHSIHLFF